MTQLGTTPTGHPVLRFLDGLEALLDDTTDAPTWTLTAAELTDALPRLTRAKSRLAEVELRVLREADRHHVGDDVGATHTAAWWAHTTGQRVAAASAMAKLAEQLDHDTHAATRDALAAGRINPDQATVILDAVAALPTDMVGPELLTDAETHLIGLADLDGHTRFDPKALRIAGRKLLEVLAPDLAEAHDAAVLEAEERHAAATATLTLRPDGHGSMIGRFKIPLLHGQILTKHLTALSAPRHQAVSTGSTTGAEATHSKTAAPKVAKPLRWGQAFCEYLETRAATRMPRAGGVPATIVVTMTLANLLEDLQGSNTPATLDTGETISAATARRLACEAGIIPDVLAGSSQPLDLGRTRRFHTEPQRLAITLRDKGCATTGCDWPPGMCHIHHRTPWSRGGKTSVEDGIMLCPRHHTLAHDTRYQHHVDTHGTITFIRRT